jgi:ABC-type transport system involved in multi-copper enzyme maturation permease subunit
MKAIAIAALKEAVRKKIFVVMGLVTILYLVLWAVILYFFQGSDGSGAGEFQSLAAVLVTSMGLQFSSMLMCLLTIVLGAGAVASELETGMIHAVLSRPLGRTQYVLGKFTGLAVLSAAYATALYAALLAVAGAFGMDTVTTLTFGRMAAAWALYLLVPLSVLCLTLYGSVSMKVVPNGLLMIFIFLLGNVGGVVEMIGKYVNSRGTASAGIFISLISPFHTLYGAAERVLLPTTGILGEALKGLGGITGGGQPASPVMFAYIAVYALGFLALAVRKFRRTDIA